MLWLIRSLVPGRWTGEALPAYDADLVLHPALALFGVIRNAEGRAVPRPPRRFWDCGAEIVERLDATLIGGGIVDPRAV